MKLAKKLFAVLLSAALALMVAVPAFAADTATITIKNAANGAEYDAYLIFEATDDGAGHASYTIPASSSIDKSGVTVTVGEDTVAFNDVFTTTPSETVTYVSQKDGVADSTVIAWLKAYVEASSLTVTKEASATGATVTLEVTPGYYYIESSLDSVTAVEINTASSDVTIYDKRATGPSVDPTDRTQGKKINGSDVSDMAVGEEGTFTIGFNATNYKVDENGTAHRIDYYQITDTPDGFEIDYDSVEVTVAGENNKLTKVATEPTSLDGAAVYMVTHAPQVKDSVQTGLETMTVKIFWPEDVYDATSKVVVTYKATLNDDHLAGDATNDAAIASHTVDGDDTPDVFEEDETDTYTHSIAVSKIDYASVTHDENGNITDDTNATYLDGADFVLKNSSGQYYQYVEATETAEANVQWVSDIGKATVKTSSDGTDGNAKGTLVFVGLKAGTYTLVEIKAPAGYNLAAEKTVVVNPITTELTPDEETGNYLELVNKVTVEDKSGSVLPSTGGMGTTLFYVFGGLLVVGAGVVLVTRKRMHE